MSYIDDLSKFLFDKERQLSSKAAVVFFVILAIFFIDNILGFSSSFSTDKKIEQVQKLNSIIKDTTIDSTTKIFALNLRSQIIERKNVIIQIMSFFHNKPNNSININTHNNIPSSGTKPDNISIKNNFWFNISAGGLYFLLTIVTLPIMLFIDTATSFSQRLATSIITSFSILLMGLFVIWVCALIPQVSNSNWLWNYLINFAIQITIIFLLVNAARRRK